MISHIALTTTLSPLVPSPACYNALQTHKEASFAGRPMKIVQYPHPALRHPVKPLANIDKQVHLYVGKMLDLMYEANGLGLAANQVALPYQVFVMNPSTGEERDRTQELVCLNPIITERKGSIEGEEGCLSFPGLYQKVRRAKNIRMRAYNLKGELFEVAASDLAARVMQHEADHLAGILYIDKMSMLGRMSSRSTLRSLEYDFEKAQERGQIPSTKALMEAIERGDLPELPPPASAETPVL
jgi:peptide deformylase